MPEAELRGALLLLPDLLDFADEDLEIECFDMPGSSCPDGVA